MEPLISVVMPVYNGDAFLGSAIDSILRQSYREFELVVVDDGSVDGTAGILSEAAKADARIRVIRQANGGIVQALNNGIAQACGEWIARMDADDVALPDRLEQQLACVHGNRRCAAVGGDCIVVDEQDASLATRKFPISHQKAMRALEGGGLPFPHPTAFIRRRFFEQVGGYRERLRHAEDVDLWLRLADVGELHSIGRVVLRLRKHSSNISQVAGGRFQVRNDYAARVCYFLRAMGLPDPASSPAAEWEDFLSWLEVRVRRMGGEEEWLRRVLSARTRGWRAGDLRLFIDRRAPRAILRHLRRRLSRDTFARTLAVESRTLRGADRHRVSVAGE